MASGHVIAPWLWAQAFTTAQRCPNTIVKSAMSSSKARGAKRPREATPAKQLYAPANADDVKAFFEMGSQASKISKQPSAKEVTCLSVEGDVASPMGRADESGESGLVKPDDPVAKSVDA